MTIPTIQDIISHIESYLAKKSVEINECKIGVYNLGCTEFKPFIEVSVNVKSINKMFKLWREVINSIKKMYGDKVLDYVDVFFTRT